jgi:hypothetical protein
MSSTIITIFVRHSKGCKYAYDEFAKRCDCRKHFRWRASWPDRCFVPVGLLV